MEELKYFQSYQGYFWQWEDEGEVLAIPQASTIAYRELIFDVLHRLSPQGLPPFGPLLMAVIATNPGGQEDINVMYSIIVGALETTDDVNLSSSISFLKLLSELEPQYKEGGKRLLLLQTIFDTCHGILSIPKSRQLAKIYAAGPARGRIDFGSIPITKELISKDIRTMSLLARRFPTIDVILERMAGMVELENPPELDPGLFEPLKPKADFIAQLLQEPQTFPIAVLVKHLWAALSIPFHHSLPSKQPLGGVSDISNKGDFDRLLVSEFANDELLFLSRMANHEALYLSREVPPASEDRKRIVVIDVSIKNWGTPKTIAYALMLALTRSAKSSIISEAYAVGANLHHLSYDTIHELIDSVKVLEISGNAKGGIQQLWERFPLKEKQELIFISSNDSRNAPEMQSLMAAQPDFFNYYIYTTAEGKITVYQREIREHLLLQEFVLPINELWAAHKKSEVKPNRYLTSIPILVGASNNSKRIMCSDSGDIFQVTAEKKLLRLYEPASVKQDRGWELIAENLPFALKHIEMGYSSAKEHVLFLFREQDKTVFLLNIDTGEVHNGVIEGYKSTEVPFVFHHDSFHCITANNNWSVNLQGQVSKSNVFPKVVSDKAKEREKEQPQLVRKAQYNNSLLKNIQQLYINETNNLVFGGHELRISNIGSILLDKSQFVMREVTAQKISKSKFTFNDGSCVKIMRSGVIVLESSNKTIPVIYIPAVLSFPLGLATDHDFTGNRYFYKEEKVDIGLEKVGPKPLNCIKIIRGFTDQSLAEVKALVDAAPTILVKGISLTKANDMRRALEKIDVILTIHSPRASSQMKQVTPKAFFMNYIDAFVKTIRNGTKN